MKRLLTTLLGLMLLLSACAPAPNSSPPPDTADASGGTLILTEPPHLTLCWDGGEQEIYCGNWSWNYPLDGDQMSGSIGCGSHPTETGQRLTFANTQIDCAVMCAVPPDYIVVTQWHGEDKCVRIYAGPADGPFPLTPGYIYAIDAKWLEEQYPNRSFWGSAEYAFSAG